MRVARRFALSALLVLCLAPTLPNARTAQSNQVLPGNLPGTGHAEPRELDFPFYSLRDGFQSLLQLVSDSPDPFSITITIHSLSGQTAVAPPVNIQPQEKLLIDMQSLLTRLGVGGYVDFEEGSISVSYALDKSPLRGQVTMSNPSVGLVYESLMGENDPGQSEIPATLEGLWWGLTPGREAKVMVANTSNAAVTADVFLSFEGQRHASAPLVFGPYETKVLSIGELLAGLNLQLKRVSEGGITITGRGTQPALIATGMIADRKQGFSTTMHFMPTGTPVSSILYASGVPIGTPSTESPFAFAGAFTPHVIVRNLLATPQNVSLTVAYPSGSGSEELALAPLTLGAYSTKDLSLDAAIGQLPQPLPFSSIRIEYSGQPGSAIAEVSSVEQNRNLVVDSKLKDPTDPVTGSGINPWHLDNETEAVLFLNNAGDAPARIGLQIQAEGAHYYLTNIKLNAREMRAIDIRKLRNMQQADFQGNKIPPNATDGSLVWTRLDKLPVVGRLLVFNSRKGISSNFSCECTFHCPTGYQSLAVIPSPTTLQIGQTQQYIAREGYGDCYGTVQYYDWKFGPIWTSSDPSVVTVNATGVATAVGPGSASITATYTDDKPKWFVADHVCNENLITKMASGTVTVTASTFGVAYSSYIPVDHVFGPSSCSYAGNLVTKIYMGDANRGTYRTAELIYITPDTQISSGFSQDTGITNNYGYLSPVNGSTLSSADEDGVPNDCYLWNAIAQLTPAFSHDESFPQAHRGQVHYSGSATNPLENNSATITWDMRTVLDTTNPQSPTAYVNYDHTCYPAHQIKVNGQIIYVYTPPDNSSTYIFGCLVLHSGKVTGQTNPTSVPLQ